MKKIFLTILSLASIQLTATQALAECFQVQRDDVEFRTIQQISSNVQIAEIFIQGKSIGRDKFVCRPLIIGGECRGKRLAYRSSVNTQDSVVWDLGTKKCYRY